MSLPSKVKIYEVGPRDGLQNEKEIVPVDIKVGLVDRLAEAGLAFIETTSFVSPKWIPQLADATEVLAKIKRGTGVSYPVLVPNRKGLDGAIAAKCDEIVIFGAASEAFSKRNTNCTIAQSIARFGEVCEEAVKHRMRIRGVISVCLGCPYDGDVNPAQVDAVAREMYALGCYEVCLADTIGVGTPGKTRALYEAVARTIPVEKLGGHFHDTYGQALANTYAALECGVAIFDSSVAGLGGCPYAKGATGNVATEDVLYMLDGLGIETGVDMVKLMAAGRFICEHLERPTGSRVARALMAKAA
jgi:hydroxymethylglutaryl-CoA lyase